MAAIPRKKESIISHRTSFWEPHTRHSLQAHSEYTAVGGRSLLPVPLSLFYSKVQINYHLIS